MIGRTLNGIYRVSELVGSGGFADVYLGRDLRTNTVVAIKILHDNFANDPALVRRFLREAQLAQSLVEPHVVRVLDAGQDGTTYYLIMEFVQGHTLAHLIQSRGPLPVDEAVGYICQVLQALAAAHQGGIIHRDIKPQNLMVTPGGLVKVMDFGIAKRTAVETMAQTTMYLGTPRYMSPEQAKGGRATAQSDLYALSITLYELLAGRTPFAAETPWQLLNLHMLAEPPPIRVYCSDVPPAIEQILARGLKKDPAQRFGSAEEMLSALREALPGAESKPPPPILFDQSATLSASAVQSAAAVVPAPETVRSEQNGLPPPPLPEEKPQPSPPLPVPSANGSDPIAGLSNQANSTLRQVVGKKPPASPGRHVSPLMLIGGGILAILVFLVVLGSIVGPSPTPTAVPSSAASLVGTPRAALTAASAMASVALPVATVAPRSTSTSGAIPTFTAKIVPTPVPSDNRAAVAATRTPTVAELLNSLYLDEFSDPSSGFPQQSDNPDVYTLGYGGGKYTITLLTTPTPPNQAMRLLAYNPKHVFGDFYLAVDAQMRDATTDGAYGVAFRVRDTSNYYTFAVDPKLGRYSLLKMAGGKLTTLIDWTDAPAIKRGAATNRLAVRAKGHSLSVLVNGALLRTVEDDAFSQGRIALQVTDWTQPISASFAKLTVIKGNPAATGQGE